MRGRSLMLHKTSFKAMSLIDKLSIRLQNHPKRVVYTAGADPRILQAARQFASRGLGVPILLGDRAQIKENATQLDVKLDNMRIIEPERSDEMDEYVRRFQGLRRFRGLDDLEAREYLKDTNYFATIMLATGGADALISGAAETASSALRPLFRIIPTQENVKTASSMLILEKDDEHLGIDGTLFLSDCAVIPDPNATQLADIAITTAALAHHLTGQRPKIAMLAYSSKKPNAHNPSILKVQGAYSLARDKLHTLGLDYDIDGELQVDAALDPLTSKQKGVASSVGGKANILIFPDLNAGNIAAKLAQLLSGARAYGQIITGLSRPAAEISRGASAHDIFGASVISAAQAVDPRYLYPVD